ncbi:MAG: LysM peptidoglycan-binding domain-containing protein [Pirellulaceae bacterium]|nr:LysM peptidoglycan-binding domain-containing protein [Pirellulaceae bacterium]
METLKTALVVVLLLAVLYGVFVVLNKPDMTTPPELAWQEVATSPPQLEFGDPPGAPAATFPPMVTTPPEMKRSITPMADAAPLPPTQSEISDQPPAPVAAETDVTDQGDSESPLPDYPIPEPAPGTSTYDSRAAAATIDDLSPSVRMDTPSGAARIGDPGQPRSVYENSTEVPQPPAASRNDGRPLPAFDAAWQTAMDHLNNRRWADALRTLSVFYDRPEVVAQERQRLVDLLDPLAGKVIYSTEHVLEPPYQVRTGETLQEIADRYQVPVSLLRNINGISDPRNLPPGSVLKVVRGPFRAEVHLAKDELALFLGDYYAGRFAVSIGNDPVPEPAEYVVAEKQEGREYFAPDGSRIPPLARDNPYGRWWIGLGGDVCIHASAESTPTHGGLGCVSLDPNDAADIFGILSIGSKVMVR